MKTPILFVIENAFFGGGERVFAQIINGLNKSKYEIYAACFPGGMFAERIRGSAEILPLDLRNRFNFSNIGYLAKIMKDREIRIVHSQGGRADFYARIAAKKAKVPAVVSTVAAPVEEYNIGFMKKMLYITADRFMEKYVTKFVAVSDSIKSKLIEKHKISSENVVRIYNGVEIKSVCARESGNYVRNEFNISSDALLVGTVGRLSWVKGINHFIKAVKHIEKSQAGRVNNIKYLVVGEGELRSELENLTRKYGLEGKIVFTGFRSDIEKIMSQLDIFVLSSNREGQPMAVLEAMAAGKPVVAADVEGLREMVVDGKTGILFMPGNADDLSKAVIELISGGDKMRLMGQAARQFAEQGFNIDDRIREYENLYDGLRFS